MIRDGSSMPWQSARLVVQEIGGRIQQARKAVVDQYSAYAPLPGQHVNGELTQGENIADIGGVKLAYAACRRRSTKTRGRNKKIDGLTPEQRFLPVVRRDLALKNSRRRSKAAAHHRSAFAGTVSRERPALEHA
jgi:Predicted metalloendopeptidase